jgi:hypothetical protein
MAKNLKNTLLINGEEYNITATYSDVAGQVKQSLTIKESGTPTAVFNGSEDATINYVSADKGGKFSNAVLIDNKYSNITEIPEQAIVNFGQISNFVSALKKAPLHSWENNQLKLFESVHGTLAGLNTIVGTTEDFETFKRLLGVPDITSTDEETRYYGLSIASTNQATEGAVGYRTRTNSTYKDVYLPSYGYYNELSTGIIDLSKGVPVTTIREKAFESNKTIEMVMIPESITTIESYAFRYCSAIKSIKLPSKLERIATETFNGCTSLKSVVIGKNVKKISREAFNLCSNLRTVYYEGTEDDWLAFAGVDTVNLSDDAKQISNKGNTALTDVYTKSKAGEDGYSFIFNYTYTPDFIDLPCLYLCTDLGTNNANSDNLNKMFLKMPNTGLFVEISRGATCLESTLTTSKNSYTYEGLAEIIARINTRLDAIGLPVTSTVLAPDAPLTIDQVNELVPHVEITNDLTEEVPTIQELAETINTLELTDESVKLSNDLKTYYNVGKITNASGTNPVTIGRAGDSLRNVFNNLFSMSAVNPTVELPSLTLTLTNNSASIEYGKVVDFTATVTANPGKFIGDYYTANPSEATKTGVTWSTLNLESTNSTFATKTSGITSGSAFSVTPTTTYYAVSSGGTIKGKATAPSGYTSTGKAAKNNLGETTSVKISSSTSKKESAEVTTSVSAGYIPYTYQLSSTLPTSLPATNRTKNKPTSITVSGGNANTYLYIFVPSSKSISTIKSGGFGVPFTLVESNKSYAVNNGKATTFKVYKTDSTVVGNTFDIT